MGRDVPALVFTRDDRRRYRIKMQECLDALAGTMTAVLEATRAALAAALPELAARELAERAVAGLKPLVARAGAVINGDAAAGRRETPQAVVDLLMQR